VQGQSAHDHSPPPIGGANKQGTMYFVQIHHLGKKEDYY
jgi:hypothetical protein